MKNKKMKYRLLLLITILISLVINESCQNNSSEKLEKSILLLHLKLKQQNKKLVHDILKSYGNIDFYYVNDTVRQKPYLDAILELELQTNNLICEINILSREIINLSDLGEGNTYSMYGDTIHLEFVKNKYEIDLLTRYFKGEYSNNISKSKELELNVRLFVESLNNITKKISDYERYHSKLSNNLGLDVEELNVNYKGSSLSVNWENNYLNNQSLISVITNLEELKSRIYISELRILHRFNLLVMIRDVSFDNLEPRIIDGEIVMTAWRSTVPFVVHVGAYEDFDKNQIYFKPNTDKLIFKINSGKLKINYKMINAKYEKYSIIVGCKNSKTGLLEFYPVMNGDKYYFESK